MNHFKIQTDEQLKNLIDEFKYGLECPILLITNYFDKLKTEIDTSAEKIIAENKHDPDQVQQTRKIQIDKLETLENQLVKQKIDYNLINSLNESLQQTPTDLNQINIDQIYNDFIRLKKHLFQNQTILFSNKLRYTIENDLNHGVLIILNEYLDVDYLQYCLNSSSLNKQLTNDLVKLYNIINILSVSNEYLLEITSDVYSNIDSLELYYKQITEINENAFRGFTSLRVLALNQNCIKSISKNAFSDLTNLEEIEFEQMNQCLLSSLQDDSFNGLSNLKEFSMFDVEFNNNQLINQQNEVCLDKNIFKNLTRLEFLRLSYCNLRTISPNVFDSVGMLREIHLSGNLIKRLDPFIFLNLTNLECLYLNNNLLDSIEFVFKSKLSKLKELNLDSNKLECLVVEDDEKIILENINDLSLASNNIKLIEDNYFVKMPNLVRLNLFDNKIKSIKANTFVGLVRLKEMNLGINSIEDIDLESFDCLNELEILEVYLNETFKAKRERFFKNLTKLRNIF